MELPHSPSCERNQEPIYLVLKEYISAGTLFEVGSGTGQHAIYFAEKFKDLLWSTSDLKENHAGIEAWIEQSGLKNIKSPIEFQSGKSNWPSNDYDYVFSANTLHIMSWDEALILLQIIGENLKSGAYVFFYGPFNYCCRLIDTSHRGL